MPQNMREALLMRGSVTAKLAAIEQNISGDGQAMSLIEAITVPAGGVAQIIRDQVPGGTPYNLSVVFLRFHVPAAPFAGNVFIVPQFDGTYEPDETLISELLVASGQRYALFCIRKVDGQWSVQSSIPSAYAAFPLSLSETYASKGISSAYRRVTRLSISSVGGGEVIPAGATIEIWGVQDTAQD